MSDGKTIRIVLVDDIVETRENIKKLLAFEPDMEVVGTAGTGREAVEQAKALSPDIIVMDINMPDMDGLQATSLINKAVPTAAVIIMSVQNDADYMRRAMMAGARDFLSKPVSMDDLYNTIRTVYRNHEAIRQQYAMQQFMTPDHAMESQKTKKGGRAGNILVMYSPQGGAGTTTVATNLAATLMREGIKVLLVDGDMQFGDIDTFLNLQAQTTILDVIADVDDLDIDHFENIVLTHESGLKVLAGPIRPEFADEIRLNPGAPAALLKQVASNYDFIIVDTSVALDDISLSLFDIATKIIMVATPSLPSVKNVRFVIDLFDQLEYEPEKYMVILNKVWDERQRKNATLGVDRIEGFLKRKLDAQIPQVDERIILSAILKGVPVTIFERDKSKPPTKQLMDFGDYIYKMFMGGDEDEDQDDSEQDNKRRGGLGLRLGR